MEKVIIFCDGASKGNPGPGGWGAIVVAEGRVTELGGFEKHTTNNRMELRAAIEALRDAYVSGGAQAILYTDSSYVINGITKWVHGWKKNGWKTKDKKAVTNQDLWQSLSAAVASYGREVEWRYVGGHVGVAGNERVDVIASDFAEGKKVALYRGTLSGYPIKVSNMNVDDIKQKNKYALSARSKAKAYSYISRVDGTVLVHKTWAECEARVKGKSARFKKAFSLKEEQEIAADFEKQ